MTLDKPLRLYLDNNIYDLLEGAAEQLVLSVNASFKAKFFSTHVTEDELNRMPPEKAEKQRILSALVKRVSEDVPSIPALWDCSPFGRTRFGDDQAIAIYDALKERHGPRDAIHVATADNIGCDYFVTEDTDLRDDIGRQHLRMKAIPFAEMIALLRSQ
jgi:predicted nucleic acid-binding protein